MTILVKKHIAQKKLVLALCDKDILGKKFSENDLQLDLSTGFYDGDEFPESSVVKFMQSAQIINIAGKESVALALKQDFISEQSIIRIKGIPHAQCIRLM